MIATEKEKTPKGLFQAHTVQPDNSGEVNEFLFELVGNAEVICTLIIDDCCR